jgi:hypothetical protein
MSPQVFPIPTKFDPSKFEGLGPPLFFLLSDLEVDLGCALAMNLHA